MRRSLIATVAATTVIVLVALLVPMGVLVGKYGLEDRLARAALEVQATETVVSGQDKGSVSVYLDGINRDDDVETTVLYPDGTVVGPGPGEDRRVRQARETGRARVDDVEDGAEIIVPVSLGGSSALPGNTPVVRVHVSESGFRTDVRRSWTLLALLGLALLAGSLLVADRLGRSFVQPIRGLAAAARRLSTGDRGTLPEPAGPAEVREVGAALRSLVTRVDELLLRERAHVADLSHRLRTPVTRLRLALDSVDPSDRARLESDLDLLSRMVDDVVREARRSEREGVTARVDARAAVDRRTDFWRPLAEDQDRAFTVDLPSDAVFVRTSPVDLSATVDALLDNVFSYTADGDAVRILLRAGADVAELVVEDDGPGFPAGSDPLRRGESHSGSTGLGLDIVRRTAEASGGSVTTGKGAAGGAQVVVRLGLAGGPASPDRGVSAG